MQTRITATCLAICAESSTDYRRKARESVQVGEWGWAGVDRWQKEG